LNFRFSDFEVDIARRELRRAGAIVHTEPQVFDLLVHLIQNRDRIVRKNELIDVIWRGRIVSETALSSRINAARRALGDNGNDQGLIRTVHKRGFRFVGDVNDGSCAPAATAVDTVPSGQGAAHGAANPMPTGEPLPLPGKPSIAILPLQNTGSDPEQERLADDLTAAEAPPPKRRTARNLLIAVPLIGLASLLWWQLSSPSPSPTLHVKEPIGPTAEAELPAGRLTPLVPSMFVRPFINLSGDAKQDYVADGITDSLIGDLTRALPGIPVVSRDTAFTYKGGGADARQIGRELGVRYLLEGSVALEGERVRVNIHLVETKEGSQLWSERFDTERNSILQVQDEIVSRVSRAIGLKVVDIEARRSWRERPSNAEFIDLIMRGRAVLNRPSSPATMIDARNLFEQALEVQPDNADALAGVATTLVFEFLNGYYETEGDKRLRTAQQLLDRALQFEPRHLMALKAQAALRRAQGKLYDAIAAAEAVIMENPGEPWAYKEIGLSTLYLGRPEQALDWFAKADRIGPRDPGRWTWLDGRGHALILLGRNEEAIRALTGALDANPRNHYTHAFLAAAYAQLGDLDEARAALATYLQRRSDTRISTFRRHSPVPLALTSPEYRQQRERLDEGLRKAGMPE
jgi:TolB-like protein/cytochrome c-type biogenesis protein CcmH/NrfG